MKALQLVSSMLELLAGVALLCRPSASVVVLVGLPIEDPAALTVVRLGGAGLLALGVACLLSCGDSQSRAARGLIAAMLIYNIAAVVILTYAGIGFRLQGQSLWPTVAIHSVMTVWCVICLRSKAEITKN